MSTLPASGYLSNAARTNAEMKTALDDVRDVISESPGGATETLLTISSGAVTPTVAAHRIDTEASASADDLTNIVVTNHPDGRIIVIRAENAARVVTIKTTGNISTQDGNDIVLDDIAIYVTLRRVGSTWQVMSISPGNAINATSSNSNLFTGVDVLTSGTSYTVPAGVYRIYSSIVGGAGGGGTGVTAAPGGGGGGGGINEYFKSTTPGAVITYAIGAGGAGGAAGGNPGSNGSVSTFDGVSASAGGGGFSGSGTTPGLGGRDAGGSVGGDIQTLGGEGRRGESSIIGGSGGEVLRGARGLGAAGGNGVAGTRGGGGGGAGTGAGGAGGGGAIYIFR